MELSPTEEKDYLGYLVQQVLKLSVPLNLDQSGDVAPALLETGMVVKYDAKNAVICAILLKKLEDPDPSQEIFLVLYTAKGHARHKCIRLDEFSIPLVAVPRKSPRTSASLVHDSQKGLREFLSQLLKGAPPSTPHTPSTATIGRTDACKNCGRLSVKVKDMQESKKTYEKENRDVLKTYKNTNKQLEKKITGLEDEKEDLLSQLETYKEQLERQKKTAKANKARVQELEKALGECALKGTVDCPACSASLKKIAELEWALKKRTELFSTIQDATMAKENAVIRAVLGSVSMNTLQ
jgi:uncharacterized protein YoxC